MRLSVSAFVFLSLVAAVLGAGDVVYKSNCFRDDSSCLSKTVFIGERIYGCEDVIDFDYEIINIQFLPENNQSIPSSVQTILVQDSTNTSYQIDDETGKKTETDLHGGNCVLVEHKKNGDVFKIDSGIASVTQRDGKTKIPNIMTEPEFIPTQLALDETSNMLIILGVKNNSGVTDKGALFAMNVNNLRKAKMAKAERISPRDIIFTGFSIYDGLNDLVVGIKTNDQYKYIKLSEVPKEDPCFRRNRMPLEDEILTILEETNEQESVRIAKLFENFCNEYGGTTVRGNSLNENQLSSRKSEDESGCHATLDRNKKLLEKFNTVLRPNIVLKDQKNKKELNDFFNSIGDILQE